MFSWVLVLRHQSNSVVRTIATTPGLPLEPEMTTEQAAYVRTILHSKNILPTTGVLSLSQLFNVIHPPENLEIHPPELPKPQIPTFQQNQISAMPVPSAQPATTKLVFIGYRLEFNSQAPTRPYISVPTSSTRGYTRHDRYKCPYIAFGFNASCLPTIVTQARPPLVVPTTIVARKAVILLKYKEGKCATTHIHRFVNALALNGETDELIKIALFGNSLTDANNYN